MHEKNDSRSTVKNRRSAPTEIYSNTPLQLVDAVQGVENLHSKFWYGIIYIELKVRRRQTKTPLSHSALKGCFCISCIIIYMETKKGIMPGGFNLLHLGHLEALRAAAKMCTELTVVLVRDQGDKGHKLYQEPIEDRYMKLKAVRYVDEVIPCENERGLLELLKLVEFDSYFLSEEYREQGFEEGKEIIGEDRLVYLPRNHNWSTTNEVNKIRG